jgi:hypothetical protein
MPRVVFKHTIPVFDPAKTIYALDGAATVIGTPTSKSPKLSRLFTKLNLLNISYLIRAIEAAHFTMFRLDSSCGMKMVMYIFI